MKIELDKEDIYDIMKCIEYAVRDKGHPIEEVMLYIEIYKKLQNALKGGIYDG